MLTWKCSDCNTEYKLNYIINGSMEFKCFLCDMVSHCDQCGWFGNLINCVSGGIFHKLCGVCGYIICVDGDNVMCEYYTVEMEREIWN